MAISPKMRSGDCLPTSLICHGALTIGDDYVDIEFGTGALKVTPGHDPNDYEMGKRCGLELINIMNKDGSMNGNAGKYEGLDRADCRTQLWKDMEAEGIALKAEPYQTRVPRQGGY